jgi:hypothetical protein
VANVYAGGGELSWVGSWREYSKTAPTLHMTHLALVEELEANRRLARAADGPSPHARVVRRVRVRVVVAAQGPHRQARPAAADPPPEDRRVRHHHLTPHQGQG